MSSVILPGATIGVLGSGQLGRMFAMAARRMGYRVHTFSPDSDTPTGQVSDLEVQAAYEDLDAVRRFARNVDVVTFEFENIPLTTAESAMKETPVRPSGEVLYITQNRLREKDFLSQAGFPLTPYHSITSAEHVPEAFKQLGGKAVLKTAGFGYDGKGQRLVSSVEEATSAFLELGNQPSILEGFVDFKCEMSVVAARGLDGEFVHYGVIQNSHRHHILDISVSPADVSPQACRHAVDMTRQVMEKLKVVGVLCVEFFLTQNGEVLINELAPRPHNSGHLTVDACVTSQFEQQLRAVCGLPLGSTAFLQPAAMANLMGDLWADGEPPWAQVLKDPDVKLHLYGKIEPRPGRKMGHLTGLAKDGKTATQLVLKARKLLSRESVI